MANKIKKRSDKIAFYGVTENNVTTYYRMKGFTDFTVNKNPAEYSRKYVDESFEQSDVVGYSPSVSFALDVIGGNKVAEDIEKISVNESLGADVVRSIVIVDLSKSDNGKFDAVKRDFAVIIDTEGSGTDAYQISGTLKAKSNVVIGSATTSDSFETVTFTSTMSSSDSTVVKASDDEL